MASTPTTRRSGPRSPTSPDRTDRSASRTGHRSVRDAPLLSPTERRDAQTHDHAPIAELTGPYFALAHRAAPLLAVAAFFAEWVAVYVVARRRALARLWPLAILCAAALAAHAGFAALLFDRPVVLGAVLPALALASSLLFGRENRRELLLLPLGASFIVLVTTVHGAAHPDVVGVMALLALWGAIYARAFLSAESPPAARPRR